MNPYLNYIFIIIPTILVIWGVILMRKENDRNRI